MTYRTLYFRNEDGAKIGRYFVFDTAAELLTATLIIGDMAYAKDTKVFYVADSASTFTPINNAGAPGTVTTVSVVSANGVSGSVANATTTPAITLALGAISPTSVNASGTVAGSNLTGTNTGDQTSVSGNAGTATALQTARTINGTSFDGTTNVTVAAAAGTLTGATLAAGVTASSLTSFGASPTLSTPILGTPTSGTLTNCTGLPVAGIAASTVTALGVGSIELGNASDTTIARSGAGAITVEGAQVILSGAALGTPASGNLSNCTALPVGSVTGLGSNVATFLATPSTANFAAAVTGETGSGAVVFGTAPTISAPVLTLDTSSSSTDARMSWDTTNKQLLVGNGTAAIEVGGSIIGGYQAVAGVTVSVFQSVYTTGLFTSEASVDEWISPGEFKIKGFACKVRTAPGGATSWAVTVRLNGVNTAVTTTISGSNTSATDTTNSVSMNAGDVLTIGWVKTGSVADAAACSWSAVLHPDN